MGSLRKLFIFLTRFDVGTKGKESIFRSVFVTFFWGLLGFCIACGITYGQNTTAQTGAIPASIGKHCLLTQEGYIDTCPSYRKKIKVVNEMFSGIWSKQEKTVKTPQEMFSILSRFFLQLQTIKKNMYMTRKATEENVFIVDYLLYITFLYKREIENRALLQGSLEALFSKTYYNAQQSGLVITSIGLFQPNVPLKVYDEQLVIQVSLRNFEQKPITTIEDMYCFVTVGQKDYIFPLGIGQLPIGANTIQKVVATVKFDNTDVTSTPGPQDMYCMLVYKDEEGNEVTTPFHKLSFTVE